MSEFVKKTIMGYYKEIPNGINDDECTHVILTKKEYNKLLGDKNKAERERNDMEQEKKDAIKKERSQAQIMINRTKNEAKAQIDAIKQSLADEQKERAYQQELNKNLLRISKERANKDRNLRPKKEHSGYVIISSTEKTYRYKGKNRYWTAAALWETVLQIPYSVDFTENQARKQVKDDLFKRDTDQLCYLLLKKIGITAVYGQEYSEMMKDDKWRDAHAPHNVMLDWRLRANYRTGYWEVIFSHTKPLDIVPKEMRAN